MGYGQCTAANTDWSVEIVKLRAAAARTRGDVVRISTGHADGVFADVTLADNTNLYRVAVVMETVASGAIYEAAIKGTVDVTVPSGTYTAGHGLLVFDGVLTTTGAAAQAYDDLAANTSMGIIAVGGTSVTSIRVTLTGDRITATT